MKRGIIIAVIFLLAGAVVNVAVAVAAWCTIRCSLDPVGSGTFSPADRSDRERWARHATDSRPQETNKLTRLDRHSFGLRYQWIGTGTIFEVFGQKGDPVAREAMLRAGRFEVIMVRIGWPANCLTLDAWRWEPHYAEGPDGWPVLATKTVVHEHDGLLVFGKPMPRHTLWPGFAVNTLLYAAVLWLLIPGPFVLRRWVRVRRGLCPKCAYPMGESDVCTECGKALPRRAFSA